MTAPARYMLDTKTASYFVDGRSPAVRRTYFAAEASASICLSVITEAELRFGLERRPEAGRLHRLFNEFFATVTVLSLDSEAASVYAWLKNQLRLAGKTLTAPDMLIASHALAAGAVLVSHDKAFQQLTPWLTVVDWATDL